MTAHKGKFGNARERVLYQMSVDGWANESSGEVEATTGYFAKIVVEPAELPEVVDAFEEEIADAGMTDTQELIGNWLLLENALGQIAVRAYEGREELDHDYRILSEAYGAWLEGRE